MINTSQSFKIDPSKTIKQGEEFHYKWRVPEELPYFKGHFPGNPVLPAIALVDLSLLLLNSQNPHGKSKIKSIKSAKFTSIVRPSDELSISFSYNCAKGLWTLIFKNKDQSLVSKIKLYLISEESSPTSE